MPLAAGMSGTVLRNESDFATASVPDGAMVRDRSGSRTRFWGGGQGGYQSPISVTY